MPLRLDVKRKLTARSDRVKSVDLHPTEPWMLASLYNGNVHVWNIESQQLVKSFEVCDLPVRASRFVARKNWVVTGSDDMQVRVYNYNTLERVHQFEAHSDYVRCIAVHPTQPFILTCSDDMTIKLWNWDKKWSCQQVFEGHSHYVMQIVINPKDNNTFASASLDRTVKVWQLGSPQPNFTLEGHQRGVNCVDYYHGGDKPYLISGADDSLVKIWDYQNKTCVQTLEGHSQNVSSVSFHPELPIILTGSEDCTVRVWHANTYRLENTLNYGLDRVWCICALKGSNNVCFGYDEGSVMVKLGREEPAMSMDVSGKIVWARHSEIQQANLKAMGDAEIQDGERLPLAVKDLGSCDIYPQTIAHNPNGRFVVVCGDGEYIIYTAMALRNKAFGPALEFVWALDSSEYAIRESNFSVKLFKNFKEKKSFKPDFGCEGIYGGYLLGCRSSTTGLAFYDWETQELVRRIEIQPRQVFWSENGDYVCIATDENYFILKYSGEAVTAARENKEGLTEDGIEDAFDLVGEVQEVVKTGKWVGDCFIYTNSVNRLNYYVGGEIVTIAHLDRTLYLLGYIPKDNRLYLGDKELNVVSYELLVSVLEYQTAVMRRDFDTADRVLPTIPPAHRTRVAHFLEKQGFKKQALAVSTDPEHRFDLALSLGELDVCLQLAAEAGSEHKWRLVADLAQQRGDLQTAQTCLLHAHDYPGLLLQATASGNAKLIQEVGNEAEGQGRNNVAFLSHFLTGNLKECLELLIKTNRVPEAAFFARTYLPSEMSRVVDLWKTAAGEKIGQSLANPAQYDNLFPGLTDAVKAQHFLEKQSHPIPAASAASMPGNNERNPIEEMHAAEAAGTFVYVPPEAEDSEFVDASQQLVVQDTESLPEDEPILPSAPPEPVAAAPVLSSSPSPPPPQPPAAIPLESLVPILAVPEPSVSPAPDLIHEEIPKSVGQELDEGLLVHEEIPKSVGQELDEGLLVLEEIPKSVGQELDEGLLVHEEIPKIVGQELDEGLLVHEEIPKIVGQELDEGLLVHEEIPKSVGQELDEGLLVHEEIPKSVGHELDEGLLVHEEIPKIVGQELDEGLLVHEEIPKIVGQELDEGLLVHKEIPKIVGQELDEGLLVHEEIPKSVGQELDKGHEHLPKWEEDMNDWGKVENLLGEQYSQVVNVEEEEEHILKPEKKEKEEKEEEEEEDIDDEEEEEEEKGEGGEEEEEDLLGAEEDFLGIEEEHTDVKKGDVLEGKVSDVLVPDDDDDDILVAEDMDDVLLPEDKNAVPEAENKYSVLAAEEEKFVGSVAAAAAVSLPPPVVHTRRIVGWDEDEVEDWGLEQKKEMLGAGGRPTIDQAQLERELELDLEKVRIEDTIDPNDINLDEEELLAD